MTPEQLATDLDQVAARIGDLVDTNRAAAGAVLVAVDPPIRTGRLASTVAAVVDPDGFDIVAGGPVAPYGPIVHARNPFITRALTDREAAVVDAYMAHLVAALT